MLDLFDTFKSREDGLISKLKLGKAESDKLRTLRQKVRERTRGVFKEAREAATDVRRQALTLEKGFEGR